MEVIIYVATFILSFVVVSAEQYYLFVNFNWANRWPFDNAVFWLVWTLFQFWVVARVLTYPWRVRRHKQEKLETAKHQQMVQNRLVKEGLGLVEAVKKLARPALFFEVANDNKTMLSNLNQLGGKPLLPKGAKLPIKLGKPLYLALQLDLSSLPKNDYLPSSGLWQLFLPGDMSRFEMQSEYQVIYYPDFNQSQTEQFEYQVPKSFPIKSRYALQASVKEQDYPNITNQVLDKSLSKFWIDNLTEGGEVEEYLDKNLAGGWGLSSDEALVKIGGYAQFVQYDRLGAEYVSIVTITSSDDVTFGDAGAVYLQAKSGDLKAIREGDMSKIQYYWDCH